MFLHIPRDTNRCQRQALERWNNSVVLRDVSVMSCLQGASPFKTQLWGVVGHLTGLLMNYSSGLVNDGKKESTREWEEGTWKELRSDVCCKINLQKTIFEKCFSEKRKWNESIHWSHSLKYLNDDIELLTHIYGQTCLVLLMYFGI